MITLPTPERGQRAALVAVVALLQAGCISLSPGGKRGGLPDLHEYDLAAPTEAVARPGGGPERPALQLEPFSAADVIDRQELVWRAGDTQVGAYSMHRWARPPEEAVREALAASLADALPGVTVASALEASDPEWLLLGHLERCEEVDRGGQWSAVLEAHLVLRDREGTEVLRRSYAIEEEVRPRNPQAVIAALRRALVRLLEEATPDLAHAIERSQEAARESGK